MSNRAINLASITLLAVGVCLLGRAAWSELETAAYQARSQRDFERERAATREDRPGPAPRVPVADLGASLPADRGETPVVSSHRSGEPAAATPLGVLRVPRLDMSVTVLPGSDRRTLDLGAGLIPGTAPPGQPGNVGLAAHRDGLFRPLEGIRVGDRVELETPEGQLLYEVTGTRVVSPEEVSVLDAVPGRDLTLVTCYPFTWLGSAPERFIVHARRTEKRLLRQDSNLQPSG